MLWLRVFLLAAQMQAAPVSAAVMPVTALDGKPDLALAELAHKALASSLERNGFVPLETASAELGAALADAKVREAGFLIRAYYSSGNGITFYGLIFDTDSGLLVDAYNLQDEKAALSGLTDVPAGEGAGPEELAERFAGRIASRIRTNPSRKVRAENLQEYVDGSLLRQLSLPRGRSPEHETDVFVVLDEQRIRTGTRTDQKLRDVPATVRVITQEEIRRRRYKFLEDLLRDQPGFDMIWFQGVYGPIFMQRGIDGPENFRTILLIDGVPDNSISSGSAYIKHKYSLHNVKRVEILYGPASSLYGANAFSGVINVITMDGEDIKGGAEVSAGSYYYEPVWKRPAPHASLTLGGVIGKDQAASVIASGHWIDTEGPALSRSDHTDPARSSYYWSEGFTGSRLDHNYMISVKGRFRSITVGAWQERDFTGQGTYATGAAYTENGRMAYWNTLASAAYVKLDQPIGSKVREQFQAVYRDTGVVDGADTDRSALGAFAGPVTVTRYRRPDSEISFDNPLTVSWSSRLRTTLGVSYARAHPWTYNTRALTYPSTMALELTSMPLPPDLDSRNKFYLTTAAAYVEQYWQILNSLSATVGYRYDVSSLRGKDGPEFCGTDEAALPGGAPNPHFLSPELAQARGCVINERRQYYSHFPARRQYNSSNPRVGFVVTPGARLTFKFSLGEAFRVPTVREVFSQSSSRMTNSNLRPEKIRTAEAGISYYPLDGLRLEGVLFGSYVRHLISLAAGEVHTPGKSQSTYMSAFQNAGSAQVYGAQLSADGRVLDWLVLAWNYTYQQSWIFDARDASMLAHRRPMDELLFPSDNAVCRSALIGAGQSSYTALCPRAHGRMPRIAPHKMNAGVTIEPDSRWLFDVRLNYVGERRNIATSPLTSVPAYMNLNLSIGTRNLPFAGTEITFRVHNALNESILDPGTRDARGDYFPAAHPQPERFFGWEIAHRL